MNIDGPTLMSHPLRSDDSSTFQLVARDAPGTRGSGVCSETSRDTWELFHAGKLPRASELVLDRWKRSRLLGADPSGVRERQCVESGAELVARRERMERILRVSSGATDATVGDLSAEGFTVVLADPAGVVLQRRGHSGFEAMAEKFHLIPGSHWSEALRGTNGIGTCLVEQTGVCVTGWDHYAKDNSGLVCYGVPLLGADGRVAAVIDASSTMDRASERARSLFRSMASRAQEAILADHWQQTLRLKGLSVGEWLDQWSEPCLLFAPSGTLVNTNAAAARAARAGARSPRKLSEWGLDWRSLLQMVSRNEPLIPPPAAGWTAVTPMFRPEALAGRDGSTAAILLRATRGSARRAGTRSAPRRQGSRAGLERSAPGLAQGGATVSQIDTAADAFSEILGSARPLARAKAVAARFARTHLPILLCAETGAGKELFAAAIHRASPRAHEPMVALNCGALSGDLLEAELFGYVAGAFTGAHPKGRTGKLEAADRGTLFLDEVAEMSPRLQATLLRFLETGTFYRVGESEPRHVDVRLICATWRNLHELVDSEVFRKDLYYRIRGACVSIPPLRERSDLRELVEGLLPSIAREMGVDAPQVEESAWAPLRGHSWPGNVRELRTVLAQAVVLGEGTICGEDVRWALGDEWPTAVEPVEAHGAPNPTGQGLPAPATGGSVVAPHWEVPPLDAPPQVASRLGTPAFAPAPLAASEPKTTVPQQAVPQQAVPQQAVPQPPNGTPPGDWASGDWSSTRESLADMQTKSILAALRDCRGNVSAAARQLGIARSTVYRTIRRQAPGP